MTTLRQKALLTDASTVAAGTSIQTNIEPFMIGYQVVARIECEDFNGTVKVQTSEDGTTWVDAISKTYDGDDVTQGITLKLAQHVRGNVTARTAGSVTVNLEA